MNCQRPGCPNPAEYEVGTVKVCGDDVLGTPDPDGAGAVPLPRSTTVYAPPGAVVPDRHVSGPSLRRMAAVLQRQGQIEPLQVYLDGDIFRTYERDAWGAEIAAAVQHLNWPTILLLVTDRWIES